MNPPAPDLVLDRPKIGAQLISESVLDLARCTNPGPAERTGACTSWVPPRWTFELVVDLLSQLVDKIDVLEKLARGWPQRQLEELLPPMWKAARKAAAQAHSTSVAAT